MAFTGQLGSSDSEPGNLALGLGADPGGPDPIPPITYADHRVTMQFEQYYELSSVDTRVTMQFEQFYYLPDSCLITLSPPDPCSVREPKFWAVIKTPIGTFLTATDVMRDGAAYMAGFKPPSLLTVGQISRIASDPISGSWTADGTQLTIADTARVWRTRLGSIGSFFFADVSVYLTTPDWRAALNPPIPLFAGVIRQTSVPEDRTVGVTVQDVFAEKFEVLSEELQIPQRALPKFDTSSIYYNNAFYEAPEGNYGQAVPIIMGDITLYDPDTGLPSATDGPLKVMDAGYVRLAAGVYRCGLVACHECYDITNIYFDGAVLPTGHAAFTEGAILLPCRDNAAGERGEGWLSIMGSARYLDVNGERYCVILFKNTASFSGYNAIVDGKITVAVKGFITDATRDTYRGVDPGDPAYIKSLALQIKHVILNFILSNYKGGTDPYDPYDTVTPGEPGDGVHNIITEYPGWFPSPQFDLYPDGTLACRVNTNSFTEMIEIENYILGTPGGDGIIGAGIIGAGGKSESFRKTLQDMLVSGGYRLYTNKWGQITIGRFDPRRANLIGTNTTKTERTHILNGSFKIEDKPEWFCDHAVCSFGLDTVKNVWNGNTEQTVPFAISSYGEAKKAFSLRFVYDDTSAQAIVAEYLNLYGLNPPRVVTWSESLCGLETEMITGVPITHSGGYSSSGWIDNVVWPHKKVIDPATCTVQFEALDVQPLLNTILILGDRALLPANWSSATPTQREFAFLGDRSTDTFADGSLIKRL